MEYVDYNCIFCAIAAKRAPADIVFESQDALAFLDIRPIVPGHILVIPRMHFRNLFDFDAACAAGLLHAQRLVAHALRAALGADGLTVVQSNERAGGQSIFHYHVHLIPRYLGDGLITRPENLRGSKRAGDALKPPELADKIRAQIRER